jgi:hypothetical protein
MASLNNRTILRPAVIIGLMPGIAQVINGFEEWLKRCFKKIPSQCRIINADENLTSMIRTSLTEVMDIRNPENGFGPGMMTSADPISPEIIIVVSAVELGGHLQQLKQACLEAKREFSRSQWSGNLTVMAYLGALGDDVPPNSALVQLQLLEEVDSIIVFSDTDGAGRRICWADAAHAASQFIGYYLTNASVHQMFRNGIMHKDKSTLTLAFGIRRLELSKVGLQELLRATAFNQFLYYMFSLSGCSTNGQAANVVKTVSHEFLASVYQSTNGSLGEVRKVVEQAIQSCTTAVQQEQMGQARERVRLAVLALMPPPLPPRRAWYQWFLDIFHWLGQFFHLGRVKSAPGTNSPPVKSPNKALPTTEMLVNAERVRLQILQLETALRDSKYSNNSAPKCPFDLPLSALRMVQALLMKKMPNMGQIVWQIVQKIPLTTLLHYSTNPSKLREHIYRLLDKHIQLHQGQILIKPEDFREAVEQMAAALVPFYPGCITPIQCLAMLPKSLIEYYTLEDYQKVIGADDEIVFCVVQPAEIESAAYQEVNTHGFHEPHTAAIAES